MAPSLMSFFVVPNASASKHKVTVAAGSVLCTKVTASISYRPAVHHVGTTADTRTLRFLASGSGRRNPT